jgi:hypothetical protein
MQPPKSSQVRENMACTLKNTIDTIIDSPALTDGEYAGHVRVVNKCIEFFKMLHRIEKLIKDDE